MIIDKLAGFNNPYSLMAERDVRASAWVYLKRSTITEVGALLLWWRFQYEITLDFINKGRQFYDTSSFNGGELVSFKERLKLYRESGEKHPIELPLHYSSYWQDNHL